MKAKKGKAQGERRWVRGQRVLCSCAGHKGPGVVDSARQAGLPPLVQIDGEELAHECLTAQLVRRTKGRSTFAATPRIPLSALSQPAQEWLRAMSPVERVAALVGAIERASDKAAGR